MGALLTATVVLIKQNRLAKIEEQRAHLDLQLNLLTEQKTTKLIDLIEELRLDLPMVKNRHDPEAAAFANMFEHDRSVFRRQLFQGYRRDWPCPLFCRANLRSSLSPFHLAEGKSILVGLSFGFNLVAELGANL